MRNQRNKGPHRRPDKRKKRREARLRKKEKERQEKEAKMLELKKEKKREILERIQELAKRVGRESEFLSPLLLLLLTHFLPGDPVFSASQMLP